MTQHISVLVIDSHALTRIGIGTVLRDTDDIRLIGETEYIADDKRMLDELSPDVLMLGLRLRNTCSIDDLDTFMMREPTPRIIILADHAGDMEIRRALEEGALGYICRDVKPEDLILAIRTVAKGRKYIPADIAQILSEHIGAEQLTSAEYTVLRMIVGGMSNKEIGFALDITENTVKSHIQNIFGKLGVTDRTSAAAIAMKRGLVRADL